MTVFAEWFFPREEGGGRSILPRASVRAVVATAIAAGVFSLGLRAGIGDDQGVATSRAALDAAKARETRAVRLLDGPAGSTPPTVQSADAAQQAPDTPAGLPLRLADHTHACGLRLLALERVAKTAKSDADRLGLRLAAHGDFGAVRRFVAGLASMPALVVPADVRMKRDGAAVAVDARLAVFPSLPGGAGRGCVAGAPEAGGREDPFGDHAVEAGSDASARLVGTLRSRRAALAVFALDEHVWSVAPGQAVGGERVVDIGTDAVTLAAQGGATRTVRMEEAE